MSSSSKPPTAMEMQLVPAPERRVAALPPRPPVNSSSAIVEYTPAAPKPEEEDIEIKLRRILECVPVRVSNTSGSSAGSGSGDFHQKQLSETYMMYSKNILDHPGFQTKLWEHQQNLKNSIVLLSGSDGGGVKSDEIGWVVLGAEMEEMIGLRREK